MAYTTRFFIFRRKGEEGLRVHMETIGRTYGWHPSYSFATPQLLREKLTEAVRGIPFDARLDFWFFPTQFEKKQHQASSPTCEEQKILLGFA